MVDAPKILAEGMSTFYSTDAQNSIVWIHHNLFNKSPIDNIQVFQLFATIKNTAKN